MIQFDSHLDTWGAYFGMSYTHGSFVVRAIEEGVIDPTASTQVAIRGMLFGPEDIERSERWGLLAITAEEMATMTVHEVARRVRERAGDRPVYLTFDIDGVDPAYAPGTGTPEVGGPSSRDATMFIQALAGIRLAGADVVEVAPAYDHAGEYRPARSPFGIGDPGRNGARSQKSATRVIGCGHRKGGPRSRG
ncbi:MAG: hypothetical protein C4346_05025 [Chloroflexota bacterium]